MMCPTDKNPFWGVVMLVLGVLFLLGSLGTIDFTFNTYWPLFLILWGVGAFLPCKK